MFLKSKSKGVTLIELLVSLNIIAFGIFVMAIVMIMLLRSGQTSIDNSSAYIVADSVMKQYLSEHKGSQEALLEGVPNANNNGEFTFSGKKFKYTIEATSVANTADMVYLKATVTEIETTDDNKGKTKKNAIITTLISPRTGIN